MDSGRTLKVAEEMSTVTEPDHDIYSEMPSLRSTLIQRTICWLMLLPFSGFLAFIIRYICQYKIKNLNEIRSTYREIVREDSPLLICGNHLTFIDSAITISSLASILWYLTHFRFFSWNLPAGDFFKKRFIFRVVAYFTKCVFVHRDGSQKHRSGVLDLCRALLLKGEVVTIFPEGRRSRTGWIDREKLAYGVGKLVATIPNCRVLCVYLRGDQQVTFSSYPKRGSTFHMDLKLIRPMSKLQGREAYREITHQVVSTLAEMEDRFFQAVSWKPST